MFDDGTWNQSYGLEGVVLGLLFLMHNPNLDDTISPEFYYDRLPHKCYAQNVKDFMAGKKVNGEHHVLDFRVIDDVFEDLTIKDNKSKQVTIADAAGVAVTADHTTVAESPTASGDGETATTVHHTEELTTDFKAGNSYSIIGAQLEVSTSIKDSDQQDADVEWNKSNISDDEDEEDILPVRFVSDTIDDYGHFVMQFGDYGVETANDKSAADVGPSNNHKQVATVEDLKLVDLARLALDWIFTAFRNIL